MKIWLSKNSEIPVREQIITQIALGILSGDLAVDSRLPSTNEIALRFGVHPNTVSAAYQKLVEQGWVEFKKGSGYYVRDGEKNTLQVKLKLDELVAEFFRHTQSLGFSFDEIQNALQKRFAFELPENFILVESDEGLREILTFEVETALKRRIQAVSFEDFAEKYHRKNALFLALSNEKPKIQIILPLEKTCIYLKSRSVAESMKGEQRPSENDLIVVVSGWEKFLRWSRTMLVAAKVEADSIVLRSTKTKNWREGLDAASMIICDSLTAENFSDDKRIRPFSLVADDSIYELKKIIA